MLTTIFLFLTIIILCGLLYKLNEYENENLIIKERLSAFINIIEMNTNKISNLPVIKKEIKKIKTDFLED